jgi:membrane fusion protein, multidrug efflux system
MNAPRPRWISIVGLALGAILAGCSRQDAVPEPIRAVKTMVVKSETAGGHLEFAAEVRARVESRLAFRVPGKLVSRSAEVGQRVRAGQVLAQIDAADLQLAQEAAAAATRAAEVQWAQSAADYKRFEELRAQGFISAAELERRDNALKAARAQLEQARAQADVQRNQAAYSVLVATADGVITAVDAEVGAVLAAGTPVVRLAHDGPRDIVFAVPEDGVGPLRALLGQPGAIQVRPWGEARTLPATLREVAAAADPVTRTFLAKADVGPAPLQLGQTATALMELPVRTGVTKLPIAAVTQQQGRTSVWLVDPQTMTVRVQPVVVGGAEGNAVVIASGLSPGQTVVTAGVHVLTPGQKVKFFPASAAPAVPASAATPATPVAATSR